MYHLLCLQSLHAPSAIKLAKGFYREGIWRDDSPSISLSCSTKLLGNVGRRLPVDKVQPLRSHQEELPPRREVPQNEPLHAALGAFQLRLELGHEM